jgi:hypothetical protein
MELTGSGAVTIPGTLGVTGATGINGGNTAYGKFIVKSTAGTGSVLLDAFQVVPTTEAVLALSTSATAATIEAYNNAFLPISIGGGGAVTIPGTVSTSSYYTVTGGAGTVTVDNTGLYQGSWPTTASPANTNVANANYARLVTSLGLPNDRPRQIPSPSHAERSHCTA